MERGAKNTHAVSDYLGLIDCHDIPAGKATRVPLKDPEKGILQGAVRVLTRAAAKVGIFRPLDLHEGYIEVGGDGRVGKGVLIVLRGRVKVCREPYKNGKKFEFDVSEGEQVRLPDMQLPHLIRQVGRKRADVLLVSVTFASERCSECGQKPTARLSVALS